MFGFIEYGRYEGDLRVVLLQSKKAGTFYLDFYNYTGSKIRVSTTVTTETLSKELISESRTEYLLEALLENAQDVFYKKSWFHRYKKITENRESYLKKLKQSVLKRVLRE